MNNTNERENSLFKKFAAMAWILHKYHQKNHHKHENMRNNREKHIENRILALLKLQEEISKKELIFILGVPKHHFEEISDKMIKEEYISFTDSENNNDILIKLTEKGKTAEIKDKKTDFDSIFDCLTEEEKENLNRYIDTVTSSVKAKLENDSKENFDFFDDFQKDSFHGRRFECYEIRGEGFHGFPRPNHRMHRDFDKYVDEYSIHKHRGFHEKPTDEIYRDCHPHEDFEREFNKRCGHKHDYQRHFDFDRRANFYKRHDMEDDRCRHGYDPHEDSEFFTHRKK